MWFLIKGSVYFGIGLVALSYFSAHSGEGGNGAQPLDMGSAITAATGAYDYVSSICVEKPDVCIKGGETFTALGFRAKEGARVAFEFLDSHLADDGKTASTETLVSDPASQPMPQKVASAETQTADRVFTGTVINVPVPMKRPHN